MMNDAKVAIGSLIFLFTLGLGALYMATVSDAELNVDMSTQQDMSING